MDREQGIKLMQDLLRRVVDKKASDLFITAGFPPAIKIDGEIRPQSERALTSEQSATLVRAIMNDRQISNSPWTYYSWVFRQPIQTVQNAGNFGRYKNSTLDAWDLKSAPVTLYGAKSERGPKRSRSFA